MSRHSFRLFVLHFVALSFIIDARINAFTIRKSFNVTDGPPQDLSVGESLQLEVRHDLKRPNGIDGDASNKSSESSTLYNNNITKGIGVVTSAFPKIIITKTEPYINSDIIETSSTDDESKGLSKKFHILEPFTSQSLKLSNNNVTDANLTLIKQINDMDNSMTVSVEEIKARAEPKYKSTVDKKGIHYDRNGQNKKNIEQDNVHTTNTYFAVPEGTEPLTISINNNNNNNDDEASSLPWKKYKIIDRKRVPVSALTTESTMIYEGPVTETAKDSITSDSLILEKKVGELHPSVLEISTSGFQHSTPNYQDITETQNSIKTTKSEEIRPELLKLETVFSKRAGFLNLSSKSKETDATTVSYIFDTTLGRDTLSTLETNLDERMKSTFADGSESQRHLEDAVKEVLLQETSLNNEEITTQNLDEVLNTGTTPASSEHFSTEVTNREIETDVTDADTTPYTNSSKAKGTKMYAVNPNYKPMKKIEVQPPKTFVRDPDDNSWRNESISSLGIVFKPKNSSKPFTQVLKNKTETEWSSLLSKDSKNDVPDLRERLEKIAQKRKTKKKKADVFGNIIYGDYEESNSSEEVTNTERNDLTTSISTEELTTFNEIGLSTLPAITTQTPDTVTTSESLTPTHSEEIVTSTPTPTPEPDTYITTIFTYIPLTEVKTTPTTLETDSRTTTNPTLLTTTVTTSSSNINVTQSLLPKQVIKWPPTTEKQKKIFKIFEYYDGSDEEDNEYLELAKLELKKKNTAPIRVTNALFTTLPPMPYRFTALPPYSPDRKPTIQYFPPRSTKPPKLNRYNNQLEKKIKYNLRKSSPKNFVPITVAPDVRQPAPLYVLDSPLPNLSQTQHYHNLEQSTIKPDDTLLPLQLPTMYKSNEYTRNVYQTTPQAITSVPDNAHAVADRNKGFNRATYAIKNYKDFLEQAAKDYDYERDAEYVRYTESPLRGITISDLVAQEKDRVKANFNYDYDVKFRKEVLQRFVDNFNHNEARYNDDFPVLYNNTVMHVDLAGNGEAVASSRAFLKGLYNPSDTKLGYARREPYDVTCDKCTVELSPAYELHYYVPDQEEKEEAEPKPTGIPLP